MIKNIHVLNFKSLKDIQYSPKNLNLLMGLNGMGKSSFIQSLLLLRQNKDTKLSRFFLNGPYTEIGKGKDAMYQDNQGDTIFFQCDMEEGAESLSLRCELKYQPESNALDSNCSWSVDELNKYSLFNNNFQYLEADRSAPAADYKTSYIDVVEHKQVGTQGEYAVHYLNKYGNEKIANPLLFHPQAKSDILLHQIDAWLGEISPGVKLNITEIQGTDKVLLDYQFSKGTQFSNRFRPKNVGFGISYVLPVIVALLKANRDEVIIIENPESHIHPHGQVELGKLISLAAATGAQIFVETHSDHIVNGVRVAVKEKLIEKEMVRIAYFDKITTESEQYSKVEIIRIDENGELSDYPRDFMDEWTNQLLKLI
ncbi:AAA family ATPase [Bacteroides faecium]|uniref:DUF3696 domain-containing protein n=1 Tax=Bacteroides faecium TaxID=2715212 RepID=A0A6H0KSU0_9BACE|nr:DUF3696 domain-containing protein [Bacteroides faecium]QIU96534.1 DUF3696 domain-containing protein [Bacteroides faecium]